MVDDYMPDTWNTEWRPGYGDEDPTLIRTRSFCIENQSQWGYLGALQQWANNEIIRLKGVYDDPHWSDPCFYAA